MSKLFSSKGKKAKPSPEYGKIAVRVLIAVIALIALLANVFTYALSVVQYYGDGMEPELHNGEILIIAKTHNVEEGDVIAFYYNNKVLVRRVICTGGRQISIAQDGSVSVNGEPLEEPYVENKSMGQCDLSFPFTVPMNNVFVMGDNRTIAMDSRLEAIGTISTDRIIGKVIFAI